MNRIDRLFGILTLLQSRKYMPAEKIADRFHISIRTVYRDIKAMTESGIPVSFEPNKGYFIVQGYFLPPVSFSSEEANALLLMEKFVTVFADKSIQKHYGSALGKVKAVLRGVQQEALEELDKHTYFQVPDMFQKHFEFLAVIQKAIASKSTLKIGYKNLKEEISTREIEPIGLVFYAFYWHIIAWCRLRREYRDFKVSRILQLQETDLPFSRKQHLSLNEYMQQQPMDYCPLK